MSYKYTYQPRAEFEYYDALNWYLEKSVDAAVNFADEIAQKMKEICFHPTRLSEHQETFQGSNT